MRVKSGSPQLTTSFLEGHFYIQDAATEILGMMILPKLGDRILEIAAAPGGKTFQLAIRMNDSGLIVALDSDRTRMASWRRNINRLKIRSAQPLIADARHLPLLGTFNLVVIDAPCSSMGVERRHPELKWWRKEEDLESLRALQLQILSACAKYVGEQGRLVYSVCSFEPEETSRVIQEFIKASGFQLIEDRYLFPHRDETDGFYIAILRPHLEGTKTL